MARVTGIGGVFFRARDHVRLQAWYEEHLGMEPDPDGAIVFRWGGAVAGSTVFAPFPHDTKSFGPRTRQFMVNLRVDDLDELLDQLRAAGVQVDDERFEDMNGRFGYAWDPEGNRIQLWEPVPGL